MKRSTCGLAVPQAKRARGGSELALGSPLPVPIESLTGVKASNSLWAVYR